MKISVRSIPQEGKAVNLGSSEAWVKALVDEALPTESPDLESIRGTVLVQKYDDHVTLAGRMTFSIYPFCDRCGEPYGPKYDVPISMHLTPIDEGGVSPSEDDLNYAAYNGTEINLAEIIRELIVLNRPIRFLCSEDCQGLCPHCGANLNKTTCNFLTKSTKQ